MGGPDEKIFGSRSWRTNRAQRGLCAMTESQIFSHPARPNLVNKDFIIWPIWWFLICPPLSEKKRKEKREENTDFRLRRRGGEGAAVQWLRIWPFNELSSSRNTSNKTILYLTRVEPFVLTVYLLYFEFHRLERSLVRFTVQRANKNGIWRIRKYSGLVQLLPSHV